MVFYHKYLQLFLFLSQNSLFVSSYFSLFVLQNSPLYNHPKSHHNDPKQQEFKIKN